MEYFGTDGIRGDADDISLELTTNVGRALAGYLRLRDLPLKVVIGRDTRVSGERIERELVDSLVACGAEVVVLGVQPTPIIAYYISRMQAGAGIAISASHNPPNDNGIKVFDCFGHKLTESDEAVLESLFNTTMQGKGKSSFPIALDYQLHIVNKVKPNIKGLKIALDCAEGACSFVAPKLFRGLAQKVCCMASNGNGSIINQGCGATSPQALARFTVSNGCDMGFCFDGDGDRMIAVDGDGTIIDGDAILYMHAVDMAERGLLRHNTVVGTTMSNLGLEQALRAKGIELIRESVGDKYVFERMYVDGYSLGGEQSGHLIFMDYQTTGDGILSAILTADLSARKGKSLVELTADIVPCPQVLTRIPASALEKERFLKDTSLSEKIEQVNKSLQGRGRVVVRPSGTECCIRIMVEADSEELVYSIERGLNELIRRAICK